MRRHGSMRWSLRVDGEAEKCPACASSRLSVLDVLSLPKEVTPGRVGFVTGCETCGLLFSNPLPRPEQLDAFYSPQGTWAEMHEERTARLQAAYLRRAERRTPPKRAVGRKRRRDLLLEAMQPHVPVFTPPPAARVLDFGCGDGKLLNLFGDLGWATYGIEPSSDIAFLRHARLDAVPQDSSFDLVIMHHVLEHVPNPLDLLRQLAGALREGGGMFISVPRLDSLPHHGDFRYCLNGRTHLVCFSFVCLQGLLARAGLAAIAQLDDPELDAVITAGQPLRMRVLAIKKSTPPPPPKAPLRAARRALATYSRRHTDLMTRIGRSLLPVRVRAARRERTR